MNTRSLRKSEMGNDTNDPETYLRQTRGERSAFD